MRRPQPEPPINRPTLALDGPRPHRISLAVFDPDLLTEAVHDAGFEHRQLHPGPFRGELVRVEVGGLTIDRGCYSQTLLARGGFSPTRVTIGILLSDREPGLINGVRARTHDLVVFPEGAELDYVLPAQTEWCSLQLERDALLAFGIPAEGIGRFSVVAPEAGQHAAVWRLMRSAVDGLVGLRDQHAFCGAILEELYQALDQQRDQYRRPNFHARSELVKRFERLADGQGAERRPIAEMAQALGVARRTLEQAFRDYIGLSPARYLTVLRLNATRRELLHASEDNLLVADLAARHGIVHLGRFAANYRLMFGETPSQTLRRMRCQSSL